MNTKTYELLIQLEVGLREFLINCIRNQGVYQWTNNFLGSIQRETINDVVKRINEAYKNNSEPELADQYFFKLNRATKEEGLKTVNLFHPFYYLNWTDLENLLRMKNNSSLIDKQIGKLNRETIIETLKPLNHIRNDVAHSRFITEDSFKFIKASFDKITLLIPDFQILINNQTSEQTLNHLINELKKCIILIESGQLLSNIELAQISDTLYECENSFWLNSENLILIKYIKELEEQMVLYKVHRVKQGGLLEIQILKPTIIKLTIKIKELING